MKDVGGGGRRRDISLRELEADREPYLKRKQGDDDGSELQTRRQDS